MQSPATTDRGRSDSRSKPRLPLEGVRIIDLTTIIFGPTCTQILADYGADVIKIESPEGDFSRHAGVAPAAAMGPMYVNLNRNKRGICLDLRKPDAVTTLIRMCSTADLFVSNVRPAGLQRLGLGFRALREVKHDIVYMSLVGYGQAGSYAARPAVDDVLQAGSGICDLFAKAQGGDPAYVPMNVADRFAGSAAAHAALAALIMRDRTGESQFVEVPMFETMVANVMGDHLMGASFEPASSAMGYTRILSKHRRPFKTADGFVSAAIYSEKHWQSFLPAIGHARLLTDDPRFTNATARAKHYPEVYGFLGEQFKLKDSASWLELLSRLDIPCSQVTSLEAVLDDPHLRSVDMFPLSEHPAAGTVREIRNPVSWTGVDLRTRRPAPRKGEHTEEVLRELGLQDADIAALRDQGAIVQSQES